MSAWVQQKQRLATQFGCFTSEHKSTAQDKARRTQQQAVLGSHCGSSDCMLPTALPKSRTAVVHTVSSCALPMKAGFVRLAKVSSLGGGSGVKYHAAVVFVAGAYRDCR